MKVERINRPARHNPRCEAQVKDPTVRWRERNGEDSVCRWPAHFVIDGKTYCIRHAGERALAHLLEPSQ